MLATLKKILFTDGEEAVTAGAHKDAALHHAAAGLLIEAAVMDGVFDTTERIRIEKLLVKRFDLPTEEITDILEAAEEATAERVELHTITKIVREHFDEAERIEMIEMLWAVVYADGELEDFEANLMRRVTGLLYVSDRDSGEARKRVLASTSA